MQNTGTVTILIEEHDRLRKIDEAVKEGDKIIFTDGYKEFQIFRAGSAEISVRLIRINKSQREVLMQKNEMLSQKTNKISELTLENMRLKRKIEERSIWQKFFGN